MKTFKKKPKYKKGDIVFTLQQEDKEKVLMCEVLGAECHYKDDKWWYSLKGFALGEELDVFSSEEDLFEEELKNEFKNLK